jgi:hypothetical protein
MICILDLPNELVNIILEYQGYHVFRHGKYIRRICETDPRINILTNIPGLKLNKYKNYNVCFWKTIISSKRDIYRKTETCFIIETHVLPSCVMWVMNVFYYYDHNDSYDDRDRIQFILN